MWDTLGRSCEGSESVLLHPEAHRAALPATTISAFRLRGPAQVLACPAMGP